MLPVVNALFLASLYNWTIYAAVLAALTALWLRLRSARREGWHEMRLRFEEVPDPTIHSLDLLR